MATKDSGDGKNREEKKAAPVKPAAQTKPAASAQKPATQTKPVASAQKPAAQTKPAASKATQEKTNSNTADSKEKAKKNEDVYDEQADIEKNKMWAGLAYLLFFLPLVTDAKTSKFARFHANQGLLFLITYAAIIITLSIVIAIINIVVGNYWVWLICWLIEVAVIAVIIVFGVINMVAAFQGKWKKLPLIGKFTIIK